MPTTAAKIALLSMTLVGAVSLDGNRVAANGEQVRQSDDSDKGKPTTADTGR